MNKFRILGFLICSAPYRQFVKKRHFTYKMAGHKKAEQA
jgi:hypothetical protein